MQGDVMLSKVSAWALLLTAPTVAQAQTNNQYDSETLLEAMDVSATQGIEVGADGCAIQVPIEEGQPRIKRDSSVWSGECVHGLANGFGHFTVNGKNSEIQTIYMGLNPPRAVFKDGFTQIKAADGSYVWRRGPEDVIAASRNGYDAYIIHKKINGVDRMVRRIASGTLPTGIAEARNAARRSRHCLDAGDVWIGAHSRSRKGRCPARSGNRRPQPDSGGTAEGKIALL